MASGSEHSPGSGDQGPAPACWPANLDPLDPQALPARCESCGQEWRVHPSLGGFRLRCRCGAWIQVDRAQGRKQAPAALAPGAQLATERDAGALTPLEESAAPMPAELQGIQGWHGEALEPDEGGRWSLRHADYRVRRRWTDRTVLELVGVMLAFWVPPLVIQLTTAGEQQAPLIPLASVATSILVLLVLQSSFRTVQAGLQSAPPRYFFEAGAASATLFFLGLGWMYLLRSMSSVPIEGEFDAMRETLGLPLLFLVVAVGPGIFEELAFRGLIQGRLTMLMGRTSGALVTGAAFALAHGVTMGFPLHMMAGVYLCFLRMRSGSLYPGMLLHIAYNGAWVVTADVLG